MFGTDEYPLSLLPKTLDLDHIKRKRQDSKHCQLCETPIDKNRPLIKAYSCKNCAKSICGKCSTQRRQLSQKDTKTYRVCDECDSTLHNLELFVQFDSILSD